MVRIAAILALALAGCAGYDGPTVQRCPALEPIGLVCPPWPDPPATPDPDGIEGLQAAYRDAQALIREAQSVYDQCATLGRVWQSTWRACGDLSE